MKGIWSMRYSGVRLGLTSLSIVFLFLSLHVGQANVQGAPAPPRIFFSDITTGPASGGESDEGAFVTLYGSGFGSVRGNGYVTIGGSQAAGYPIWTDNRVAFQLGKNAQTGDVVVHLDERVQSNSVSFTVGTGRILFFPGKGKESLQSAIGHLHAGDILYLRDGTEATSLDRYDAVLNITSSGHANKPIAVVAYPGATATIGSIDGPLIAARTPNVERTSDHWVIAGLHFRGNQEALDLSYSKDWRIIGNDFTCPHGFGPTGCVEVSQTSGVAFLGNTIHDVAKPGTTKVYHGLYFTTDSNHIDVGWNTIADIRGCRGLQFHSSPEGPGTGQNQYDLRIHDNVIHDTVCDAINLATINPSRGPISVFNNLIYNVGLGPDPPDGSANYSCVYVQGGANRGAPGSGIVEIYNNTMYRCGSRHNTDSGGISLSPGSPQQQVRLRNNVIVLDRGIPLLSPNSISTPLVAEKNILWWLDSSAIGKQAPSGFTVVNPQLRDPQRKDFRLSTGSPALDHGITTGLEGEVDGRMRNKTSRPNIGAY